MEREQRHEVGDEEQDMGALKVVQMHTSSAIIKGSQETQASSERQRHGAEYHCSRG